VDELGRDLGEPFAVAFCPAGLDVLPSTQPSSRNRGTKPAVHSGCAAGVVGPRIPTVGSLAGCCARTASGKEAVVLARPTINLRRLTSSPQRPRTTYGGGLKGSSEVASIGPVMSALGQKQTLHPEISMSALTPKADIAECNHHVRFVPNCDIGRPYLVVYAGTNCSALSLPNWSGEKGNTADGRCIALSGFRG